MDAPRLLLLLGNIGAPELIFLFVLIVLLFGAHKIPELARSLGKAQKEFSRARQELENEPAAVKAPLTDEERVRKAAQDLGIDTNNKSLEELRADIALKVKA